MGKEAAEDHTQDTYNVLTFSSVAQKGSDGGELCFPYPPVNIV